MSFAHFLHFYKITIKAYYIGGLYVKAYVVSSTRGGNVRVSNLIIYADAEIKQKAEHKLQ